MVDTGAIAIRLRTGAGKRVAATCGCTWRLIALGVCARQDRPYRPRTSLVPRPSPGPPQPMPFVRYLLHDGREVSQDDDHQFDSNFPTHLSQSSENDGQGSSPDVPGGSSPLQFHLPYFMTLGSSTVAPGGGAEVLPFSQVQPTGDPSPDWLSSSLFPLSPGDQ